MSFFPRIPRPAFAAAFLLAAPWLFLPLTAGRAAGQGDAPGPVQEFRVQPPQEGQEDPGDPSELIPPPPISSRTLRPGEPIPEDFRGASPPASVDAKPAQGAAQEPAQGVAQAPAQGAPQAPAQGVAQAPAQGAPQTPARVPARDSAQAPAHEGSQAPAPGEPPPAGQGAAQAPAQGGPRAPAQGDPRPAGQGAAQAPAQDGPQAPAQGESRPAGQGAAQAPPADPQSPPAGVEITESNINETLTLPKDGEVRFGGSLMVWKDNRLYRKNEDGSLTLVDSSLDTMTDEHGQRWLTQDNEGHVLIQVSLRVWATINFEYNSAEILESSEGILTAFGHALNTPALRDCGLIIAGHTDGRGSESYNMELSRRRASSVAEWLTERMGIAPERLILTAYGLSHPVADNSTAEGRAKNRRVEFILLPANGDSRP